MKVKKRRFFLVESEKNRHFRLLAQFDINSVFLTIINLNRHSMNYLRECPFCECTDVGVQARYDGLYINDPERRHPDRYLAFSAICPACGARGPIVKVTEDYSSMSRFFAVETAATLWNGDSL
ncbi:hypothetical protein [Paraburkholderia sp. A3RO-2L]|uniref:hypothetical protein n=1 Tax=Paraburkholderia sp. A3RO-2L TaxID=3028376 RepID=UPI003DA7C3A2